MRLRDVEARREDILALWGPRKGISLEELGTGLIEIRLTDSVAGFTASSLVAV